MQKSKYIALSSYCKNKGLSLPKDKALLLQAKLEAVGAKKKITGIKYLIDDLDKIVPQFGLKPLQGRKIKPKYIYSYGLDGGLLMLVLKDEDSTIHEKILDNLDYNGYIDEISVFKKDNAKNIFEALSILINEFDNEINQEAKSIDDTKEYLLISKDSNISKILL